MGRLLDWMVGRVGGAGPAQESWSELEPVERRAQALRRGKYICERRVAREDSEVGVRVVRGCGGCGRVEVSMGRSRRGRRPGMLEIVAREKSDQERSWRTSHQKCDCMPRLVWTVRWRTRLRGWVGEVR